ncbi:hypothetical protein [Methanimicrococcus hongohii]|uniref:hypothetical protein n=1 Tax=Methanimicrococcus hongohii TaxID=3028295 RepID=UPI0029304C30|nr:hypothetical protein [Methanimicrococcus sp. Hf6]
MLLCADVVSLRPAAARQPPAARVAKLFKKLLKTPDVIEELYKKQNHESEI